MTQRTLAAGLFFLTCAYSESMTAAQDADSCSKACAAPSMLTPIAYSDHIARAAELKADVVIQQPCACVRQLNLSLVFTPVGSTRSREHDIKLSVPQGGMTAHVALTSAELAKLKVAPGQYTLGWGLRDDRDEVAGQSVSGLLFTYGTPDPTLSAKPALPPRIERDAALSVPFTIGNRGDIGARVTALVVFTRPDSTAGIEVYSPQFVVPSGGTKHVMQLSAAKRRALQIGPGPWLVSTAAFDAADQRLGFFPGHLLFIGKTLAQPKPAQVQAPSGMKDDLRIELSLKNDADVEDVVTAVLLFSKASQKPIEYKLEGLRLPPGTSTHPITLTALDRYNLGLRAGKWRISTTALDRAGKRIELQRGADFVLADPDAQLSAR